MLYFANPSTESIRDAMRAGRRLGMIATPKQGNAIMEGVLWCADNGCFGKGYPGDSKWLVWLGTRKYKNMCAFATVPDVVGDAEATLERSEPFFAPVRQLGYRAALVGQDGLASGSVPWDKFDAFFVGGSTEWKLGPDAKALALEAKDRGKWVHVGRVNSRKRLYIAQAMGADSCDGTYMAFGPDINLARMTRWLDEVAESEARNDSPP